MKKIRICFEMNKDDHKSLQDSAKALDMTESEFIRHAVKEFKEREVEKILKKKR